MTGRLPHEIAEMNIFQQLAILKLDPSEKTIRFETEADFLKWKAGRNG